MTTDKSSSEYKEIVTRKGKAKMAKSSKAFGIACTTGEESQSCAEGSSGIAASTGELSSTTIYSKGKSGVAASTGKNGRAYTRGDNSVAVTTGVEGYSYATGDSGVAIATGENSCAALDYGIDCVACCTSYKGGAYTKYHENGVVIATGYKSEVMGNKGNALFLCERDEEGTIINTWSGIVGRDGIEPDTIYTLVDGKPVERREKVT